MSPAGLVLTGTILILAHITGTLPALIAITVLSCGTRAACKVALGARIEQTAERTRSTADAAIEKCLQRAKNNNDPDATANLAELERIKSRLDKRTRLRHDGASLAANVMGLGTFIAPEAALLGMAANGVCKAVRRRKTSAKRK